MDTKKTKNNPNDNGLFANGIKITGDKLFPNLDKQKIPTDIPQPGTFPKIEGDPKATIPEPSDILKFRK